MEKRKHYKGQLDGKEWTSKETIRRSIAECETVKTYAN